MGFHTFIASLWPYFLKKLAPRPVRGEGIYRAFNEQKYFFKKSMQNPLT
nr:MAG TPA: hypothetical protein [Caudoviricetes sp.]